MIRTSAGELAPPFCIPGLARRPIAGTFRIALAGVISLSAAPWALAAEEPEDRAVEAATALSPLESSTAEITLLPADASADSGELRTAAAPAGAATLASTLRDILLLSLDERYVDERHWGATAERFDGWRLRGVHSRPRTKAVPHGLWRRYEAALIAPTETLQLTLTPQPATDSGAIPWLLTMVVRARCKATHVAWTYGLKGANGTAVFDVTLRLRIVLETTPTVRMSLSDPLPRISLRPQVREVKLSLLQLEMDRAGVFDGKLIELLGSGSRETIEQLIQTQEAKLQRRLQEKLEQADARLQGKS